MSRHLNPSQKVIVYLTSEDCSVLADLLEERRMNEIAVKFKAAISPKATWTFHLGKWRILCSPEISTGDHVFVQKRNTDVREILAGEKIAEKNNLIIRDFKRIKS